MGWVGSLTDTVHPGVVERVAHGTFTAEGAVSVDTVPIVADAWILHAFIQVWQRGRERGGGREGKREREGERGRERESKKEGGIQMEAQIKINFIGQVVDT